MYKPKWHHTRGPATKQITVAVLEASSNLTDAHKAYFDSKDLDFLKMTAGRAQQLIDASLNNDSRLRASLLKQMKPWTPARHIRLADLDGIPAHSYTQEKVIIQG